MRIRLRSDAAIIVSFLFLLIVVLCALFGPHFFDAASQAINLRARNTPPFSLANGWLYVLGSDSLGRSILARLIVASRDTMAISVFTVLASATLGGLLGIVAGLGNGVVSTLILRAADVVMSFPSLLIALIVLYILGSSPLNIVLVLAISRLPVFIRTARSEVLELRERPFIAASKIMGAGPLHLVFRHYVPLILPTILILAGLDLGYVMLAESALSFLGLGIQPPSVTWGLMVADGRAYLATAWWLTFWPGLAITLTVLAANIVANWINVMTDPALRPVSGGEVVQ